MDVDSRLRKKSGTEMNLSHGQRAVLDTLRQLTEMAERGDEDANAFLQMFRSFAISMSQTHRFELPM